MSQSSKLVVQLRELLGPKPNHPWGALLPQVLLWCFRRFCVDKLMSIHHMGPLSEQVWADHFELVNRYSPKGLNTISKDWLTPENIDTVYSSLEEWDRFFIECLGAIDDAMQMDDESAQDQLSEFLDEELSIVIRDWLDEEFQSFRIFPLTEADDDIFTDTQLNCLVQALMNYAQSHPEPVVKPEPIVEPEPVVEPIPVVEPEPDVEPPAPVPAPAAAPSVSAAIHNRRRTLCLRPRDRSTRGKTKKLEHRA
jgi:hypothetical protein